MVERNAAHPTTIKKSRCTDQNLFSEKLSCQKSLWMGAVSIVLSSSYLAAKYFSDWGKKAVKNFKLFLNSHFKII